MCNHLNLKILIHIFTIIFLITIIIITRGENFVAHLDGLGDTPVCRGTPVAHHCPKREAQAEDVRENGAEGNIWSSEREVIEGW
jgi:hypothetical protein